MKLTLIIAGVFLEVVGLPLTASPELAPRAQRAATALRNHAAKLEARIRRLLKRPKHITVQAGVAGGVALSGRASVSQSVPHEADLETKLRFLLGQAERNQERLNEVEHRVAELPGELRRDVEATRAALEEQIAEELEQAREVFIGRRLFGLACIATGSVLLAVVNLL